MKNIKKSVKRFLTATALAGAGLIGLLNSSESKAHPPSIQEQRNYFSTPLYFGHHHINHDHHHIYTHDHHNHFSPHEGLHIIDASLRAMFWGNLIRQQAIEEERLRTPNYRIRIEEPMNLPQTFIANCYQDFDRDGYVDFPQEFVGIGKTKFDADESILIGLKLPSEMRGKNKNIETRLYKVLPNKDKKLVNRHKEVMSKDNLWRNFKDGSIYRSKGAGNYEAEFYFEGKHWNTIPFRIKEPINLPQTFIANDYQDFNRDGSISYPKEFIGIGKTKFDADESITIGLRLPLRLGGENKKVETRLYRKISDETRIFIDKKEIITSQSYAWRLARGNKTGNYEAEFHLDGRYLNTIPFEIVSDNPLRDVKVIVEPLGVFEKAPKPY